MTRVAERTSRTTGLLWALRVVGAVLLAAMAWIHLDLWLDGYREIAVIGPMFLLNVAAGAGLAVLLLATPRRLLPWAAALAALTFLASLVALVLSSTVGLFGFMETTAAPLWWESFWVELAGLVVCAALAALAARRR